MAFDFLTGGARSGKSRAAEQIATAAGGPVIFVATAEAGDAEMAERIRRHRSSRPRDWETVEEHRDLAGIVHTLPDDRFLIVDCLTLWLANVSDRGDEAILADADRMARALAERPGRGVVVSNEVGDGIVPADPATRRYRDLLGTVNRLMADRAERAFLMVAGRALRLERPPW
ncbi:MAG: bifunctional adenosylcobinamide kinase/adenosylcobinamide-phosphate guanylyltransferase [Acidimicrobiia bacterium]|nr:bifunctional adenosylcobinamide kinase/adenosylcobinamide-phosphate guanylyltransferase [Acidimicrobiia bacterium]